jgi:hypothetical protein
MIKPIEICLEELDRASEDDCFVRCVALPSAAPGLALDRAGTVQWLPESPAVHALLVSADGRLMVIAAAAAGPLTVARGTRSLTAPDGQPVFLLDQDELVLDGRRLRVHVHGETEVVEPPERLSRSALGRLARAAATAVALGGALAAGAAAVAAGPAYAPAPIEVRVRPPKPAPPRKPIDCTITSQKASGPQGPVLIKATCAKTNGLYAGSVGHLLDPRTGKVLDKGEVKVTKVTGNVVEATAAGLTKASPAKEVRFMVHDW